MKLAFFLSLAVVSFGLLPEVPPERAGLPVYPTWDTDMINVDAVAETGAGVYIAVLDTGLAPNWRDYFPAAGIDTRLAAGFEQPVTFRASAWYPCGLMAEVGRLRAGAWLGSVDSTHGTHVVGTILGYAYFDPRDTAAGFPLPPIRIRGLAPEATIIPVKVLSDHQVPAMPACGWTGAEKVAFGTEETIAAGIDYAVDLALAGFRPMIVNLSAGAAAMGDRLQAAIDRAVSHGVVIVAAAGNSPDRMTYPGAYAPVISVGAAGWTRERGWPATGEPGYPLWWLQAPAPPLPPNSAEVADPTPAEDVYVAEFSSRALAGQQLDLLAPGSHVRGPFPASAGYSHLPWWANGAAALAGTHAGSFYFAGGTSMATPHVAAVAALLLQRNPALTPTSSRS